MRGTWAFLPVFLFAASVVFSQSGHPFGGSLNRSAVSWLKNNNAFGPDHVIVSDLGKRVYQSLGMGRHFSLFLGKNLIKSGKASVAASWNDQLFLFELSDEQWSVLGLGPGSAQVKEGSVFYDRVKNPRSVTISDLRIADWPNIDGMREVTGVVTCEQKGLSGNKLALRMAFSAWGSTEAKFFYVDTLKEQGKIQFRFPAINDQEGRLICGPLVVFCDLCEVQGHRPGEITVLSNPLALLLNVR